MIALIDSHCHIVFSSFKDDLENVASRWRDAGVTSLLHACVEPSEIPAIRLLADRFPELRYSVGVHPLDTKHWKGLDPQVLGQFGIYKVWRLNRRRLQDRAIELIVNGVRPNWRLPKPERF